MTVATQAVIKPARRITLEAPEVNAGVFPRAFSVTRWGLIATLLVAPLAFGAVEPWARAALLIISLGLLWLWTIGNVQRGFLRIHWSPLYLPASLFLVLSIVQFYGGFTMDFYATREAIFKLITDLIFFFLAVQLFAEAPKAMWRRLGPIIAIYAFSLGLFAILQFFTSHNMIYWTVKSNGWTFGPYVNHNDFAGLMEMLIPINAAYVLSRPRTDPRRLLLALSLCVPVASVMLSGSRGGLVALLVETLMLGCILWRRRLRDGMGYFSATLGLGATAAVLLFLWMAPNRIVKRLGELAYLDHAPEVTLGQREVATIDTLNIFLAHPWIGIGLGSFDTVFPQYRTFPTDLGWAHAHNDYAEALAETGVAGGIMIVFALVLFLRWPFRLLDHRLGNEAYWIQLGAALGCCGLLVHSFVDFNLHIPANAAWFAVCAAMATAPGSAVGQWRARSKGPR